MSPPPTALFSCGRRCKKAFTIIELGVVIGIVAILIALLFPTMEVARKKSEESRCLANIKACGNALLLHAGENRMELALPWGGDESAMASESIRARYPDLASHPQYKKSWVDFLIGKGYLNAGAEYCPSHIPRSGFPNRDKIPWGFAYGMRRYNYVPTQYLPMNSLQQGRTRNFVLLGDSIRGDGRQWYYTHHPSGGSANQFHFRHDGRAAFFCLDGSVHSLTPAELLDFGDGWQEGVVNVSRPQRN